MTTSFSHDSLSYDPVGPSLLVRLVIGPMTRILNPVMRRVASRRHFSVAGLVHHQGRHSGRRYTAPVLARHHAATIVIPLTFGNRSDWCRNVLAAGRCLIRTTGVDYDATAPQLLDRKAAAAHVRGAFNPMERATFRMLGIRQFMILAATPHGAGDVVVQPDQPENGTVGGPMARPATEPPTPPRTPSDHA